MQVEIFTDGACSGNPGKGGWGAILRALGKEKELSGYDPDTTNNRMELTAVIEALKALKYPCDVTVTTDSRYVCDGITKGWAKKWRQNGWVKSNKKPVLNSDLWEELLTLCGKHNVNFVWVKGHAEHPENERCDGLAREAITKLI
jgi:ribonuclease HI